MFRSTDIRNTNIFGVGNTFSLYISKYFILLLSLYNSIVKETLLISVITYMSYLLFSVFTIPHRAIKIWIAEGVHHQRVKSTFCHFFFNPQAGQCTPFEYSQSSMIFWKGAIHKWWHPFFEIFYLSSVFITHFTNRLMEVTFWQIPLPPEWVTSFMDGLIWHFLFNYL